MRISDWSSDVCSSDLAKQYSKGDVVKVKVLDVDVDKERVSLGIKQLGEDPFAGSTEKLKKGDVVTCTVHQVTDNGIEVQIGDGAIGFIRKSELSRDRSEQQQSRSEEHTSELQSLMRITYAVFCLKN